MSDPYPNPAAERDRWILARRKGRDQLDPFKPYAFFLEDEPAESGEIVSTATLFLTNRECPWRCLMCDLWRHTLAEAVPLGAIPAQIDHAMAALAERQGARPRQVKLYNSGSFFDPRAIPSGDHPAIATRVSRFDRVIVECHPALVGESCLRFRDLLVQDATAGGGARLEVAMGLETAHPETLEKLNKRMTLEQFRRAADFLGENGVALRAFVLVKPPFLDEADGLHWAQRSVDFAFDCGATAVSLIPTRPGNGALESLAADGGFSPPRLGTLEAALDYGIGLRRGRVFADVWDLEKFSDCPECFEGRRVRLARMNLEQAVEPPVPCRRCGGKS